MAKEEVKKACDCAEKECNCCNDKECKCGCGCGCGCGCKCGCKCKLLKLFALIIVFLAGIGCGCLICCCNGCKSYHRVPAPIAMAKHAMHQPKNKVIVIRTDGDEVVPEVAKVDGNFRGVKKLNKPQMPKVEAPVVPEAPVAETPAVEVPAEPAAPAEAEAN